MSPEEYKKARDVVLSKMTKAERANMYVIPMAMLDIVWRFVEGITAYCADNMLDNYKKASRELRQIHTEYIHEMAVDIDARATSGDAHRNAAAMVEEQTDIMLRIFYTIDNAVKKRYPDDAHSYLRTRAYMARQICTMVEEHNDRSTALLRTRTGYDKVTISNTFTPRVKPLLDMYLEGIDLSGIESVDMSLRTLRNAFIRMERKDTDNNKKQKR